MTYLLTFLTTFLFAGAAPAQTAPVLNALPIPMIEVSRPEQLHLAKSIKGTFKSVATTAKPPVARTRPPVRQPTQRKSQARPAPAPKGFGTFMSPGGSKIGGVSRSTSKQFTARKGKPSPVRQTGNRAFRGDFARASQRGTLRQRFNRVSQRGGLRPKFNRTAKPQKPKKASFRGGLRSKFGRASKPRKALARGTPPKGRRGLGTRAAPTGPNSWSLTRTFNRASGATQQRMAKNASLSRAKGRLATDFRKSARYPGAKGPIRWRTTRPGEVFWRSHNGAISGKYASMVKPTSARDARNRYALPPGNSARLLSKHVSPGSERVGISLTARHFGRPGGGVQAYFPIAPTFKPAGWNKGGLRELFTGVR